MKNEPQVHMTTFADCLKAKYLADPILPESDHPPALQGGDYIRLALIQQERSAHSSRYKPVIEMQKDYTRGNFDKILKHKTEINLDQLFRHKYCAAGTVLQPKVLIDGAPGVGKTTLTRKVCKEWANNNLLKDYRLVILLHLRDREISIAKSIEALFDHDDEDLQKLVVKNIKQTEGEGIAIIFDGFDELTNEERASDSLVLKIIKGKVLRKCSVFVTSRPYASGLLQQMSSINQHVEVLGFTDEQVHDCIMKSVGNQDKALELCTQLSERLDIISLCHIPLNCRIVLFVYQQEDHQLPKTLTELYELFVVHTMKRHTKRLEGEKASRRLHDLNHIPTVTKNKLHSLCKMAFEGLMNDGLIFQEEELDEELGVSNDSDVEPHLLDLMNAAKSFHKTGSKITYSFLHLTIQEFLAAKWVVEHISPGEQLKFLEQNFANDRFRMMLLFMAGLLKDNFSIMSLSAFKCFDFSPLTSPLQSNEYASMQGNSTLYSDFLWICHMIYESDSQVAVKSLAQSLDRRQLINFQVSEYSTFECLVFASFLANSNSEWEVLELSTCTVERLQVFRDVFSTCKPMFSIKNVKLEHKTRYIKQEASVDTGAHNMSAATTELFPHLSMRTGTVEDLQGIIDFSELLPVEHVELSLDLRQYRECKNLDKLLSNHRKVIIRILQVANDTCPPLCLQHCDTITTVTLEVFDTLRVRINSFLLTVLKSVTCLKIHLECPRSQTNQHMLISIFKSLAAVSLETLLVQGVRQKDLLTMLQEVIGWNVILKLQSISFLLYKEVSSFTLDFEVNNEVDKLFEVVACFLSTSASTLAEFKLGFGISPFNIMDYHHQIRNFIARLADATSLKKVEFLFNNLSIIFERNVGSSGFEEKRHMHRVKSRNIYSQTSTMPVTHFQQHPSLSINPNFQSIPQLYNPPLQTRAMSLINSMTSSLNPQQRQMSPNIQERGALPSMFLPEPSNNGPGYGHYGVQSSHTPSNICSAQANDRPSPMPHFQHYPSLSFNPTVGTAAPHLDLLPCLGNPRLQHRATSNYDVTSSFNRHNVPPTLHEYGPLASHGQAMPVESHWTRASDFDPNYVPTQDVSSCYHPAVQSSITTGPTTQITRFQQSPYAHHDNSAYTRLRHGVTSSYNVTRSVDTTRRRRIRHRIRPNMFVRRPSPIQSNPFPPSQSQQPPADTYPHPNSHSNSQ